MSSRNGNASESAEPPAAAASMGATLDEPISLLDDSDDEDYGDENENQNSEVAFLGTRTATATSRKQPLRLLDDQDETTSATTTPHKKIKLQSETAAVGNDSKNNDDYVGDACMRFPRNPIKIFATDRDVALRKHLKRRLKPTTPTKSIDPTANLDDRHHWSNRHCWTFREMLGFDRFSWLRDEPPLQPSSPNSKTVRSKTSVGIHWMFITTYILDVDFLLNELPELMEVPIVVIVYQYKDFSHSGIQDHWVQQAASKGHALVFLVRDPRAEGGTPANPLKHTLDYGCHHTKMTLVGYCSGRLRVQIHTSNLRREDVHDKCQGAFVQDFVTKTEDQLDNFVTSDFEESLVTYLESYQFLQPLVWNPHCKDPPAETLVSHLQTYDFSTAVGVLIPSVPGYHKHIRIGDNQQKEKLYGYLKVQQAIRDHCNDTTSDNKKGNENQRENPRLGGGSNNSSSSSVIVCQFSSMGSLSKPYLNKIADAWNSSPATTPTSKNPYKKTPASSPPPLSSLRIVWPTVQEITTSVEGIHGGASVPGRTKNLSKDFLRPLLHKWRSSSSERHGDNKEDDLQLGKGPHVPHIKSYYALEETDASASQDSMRWFVLTSHNLSKAAWGEIQNRLVPYGGGSRSEVLAIQHWELGVFVAPSTLGVESMGPLASSSSLGSSSSEGRSRATIPLPYKVRPEKYQDSDRPWVVE